MGIREWEDIAIPEGFGPHRLLYNPASETVIAELRSIGERSFPNRIYTRKKDSPRYEPIQEFEQRVSCESAVTPLERPLLFYLSIRWTKHDEGFGGDWDGLFSFDLEKRTHRKVVDKDSLTLPSPFVEGWVSSLIDVSPDGSELYLTAGIMAADTGTGFRMVNHQLARMRLPTGDIHLLSHLKGAFF